MRLLRVGGADVGTVEAAALDRGHAVQRAASLGEALEALARGPTPDLLVVGGVPDAPPSEAVRRLRGHVRGEVARIVAVADDPAAAGRMLDAGADLALVAPVSAGQAEAALHAAGRERPPAGGADPSLGLLFARNPNPMWFFDVDDLAFLAVNDAAVARYGWSREEFLRMTLRDIRPAEDVPRLLQVTGRVGSGYDQAGTWRHRRKDGTVLDVEIHSYPVPFAGRACELVLALDVTERVEQARLLEELRARLALADRMASVGTLAAGIAHEINNPLTYVLANLDFVSGELSRSACAPATREALGEALEGARRVQEIVRDLKAFSRPGEDAFGSADLRRVVRGALAIAANEIRHRAAVVEEIGEVPLVAGGEGHLGQVLLNLLVNAAQAIPVGDREHQVIRIAARREGDRVVVEVSDTGAGIPAEVQGRVFDPFFTTKQQGLGTGLGLWVCRRIVTALGGDIDLASEPGRGTTVRLSIPVAARQPAPPAGPAPPAAPGRRLRVLVVDDEPRVGRSLLRILHGWEVVLETDGRDAVGRIVRGERFDAILCDVMMPQMRGSRFHAEVAAVDAGSAARIVFMSGGVFSDEESEFLARSGLPCLEKPFDPSRLRGALAEAARDASPRSG